MPRARDGPRQQGTLTQNEPSLPDLDIQEDILFLPQTVCGSDPQTMRQRHDQAVGCSTAKNLSLFPEV
jgi:hypothetical protein